MASHDLTLLVRLDPHRPVVHVSYYEADAYARWANARLPSEAEWEHAACGLAVSGHFAADNEFHPRPVAASACWQFSGIRLARDASDPGAPAPQANQHRH